MRIPYFITLHDHTGKPVDVSVHDVQWYYSECESAVVVMPTYRLSVVESRLEISQMMIQAAANMLQTFWAARPTGRY